MSPRSRIWGTSYKDDSTLRRLKDLGFANVRPADPEADWGLGHGAGVESLQAAITPGSACTHADRQGQPDVILFRHALEHAHDIATLFAGLRELVAPDGRLVFEVPDATRALECCDYSTVWEEHLFYFTPFTLRHCLEAVGFEVELLRSYHYSHENALVAIASPSATLGSASDRRSLRVELNRARRFIDAFAGVRDQRQEFFADLARTGGGVALLGAGHLSAAYLNLLGIAPFVEFVVDDAPQKQGLYMPGSRLPILPSSALIERRTRLCLMSVRPEIEDAVVRKNHAFTSQGGRMASIFPGSPYALEAALAVTG
jgi:hypothetical protein